MVCEYHILLDEKMRAISLIQNEFNARVKELRDNCGHVELTNKLLAYRGWVRLCRRCMMTVERGPGYEEYNGQDD